MFEAVSQQLDRLIGSPWSGWITSADWSDFPTISNIDRNSPCHKPHCFWTMQIISSSEFWSLKWPYCGFCSNRILLYFPLLVCSSVTGVTSHISHIYKGINAMLIIRGPIKPYSFWIKIILAIFLAKTRPDKTIFSALTNPTIDFDFELSKI